MLMKDLNRRENRMETVGLFLEMRGARSISMKADNPGIIIIVTWGFYACYMLQRRRALF